MDNEDAAVRLAELALDAQSDEYKEIWEQWKAIDAKAQGVIVVSGIAITGLFAVLRESSSMSTGSRWLVAASVVATFAAAVCALTAVRVRSVTSVPLGETISKLVAEIQQKPLETQQLQERHARLLNDIRALWIKPLQDNAAAVVTKSRFLFVAQILVILSMMFLGVITIYRIFNT